MRSRHTRTHQQRTRATIACSSAKKSDVRWRARRRRPSAADVGPPLAQIFFVFNHFFVDIDLFSSIIYILYEGGGLRPPVVRPRVRAFQLSESNFKEEEWRRRVERKRAARSGNSRPTGSGGAQR